MSTHLGVDLPDIPVWASGPYPAEEEAPGVMSRICWTRDETFTEGLESIDLAGGLAETITDGAITDAKPLVYIGTTAFPAPKAREIAAAILRLADLVDPTVTEEVNG